MAEAFARRHGGEHLEAVSAGSHPADAVNPRAVASMAERGYDLTTHRPKAVVEVAGPFDVVVTMGCGDACPIFPGARYEDWALQDPREVPDGEFAAVRDDIEHRVLDLLGRLRLDRRGT